MRRRPSALLLKSARIRKADAARQAGGEKYWGETAMQSVLLLSFAVSIVLGMWLIWKMTP